MNDKDRWSAHLEFCKVVITLASALITATAILFLDPAKMPRGASKWFIFAADASLVGSLICAILASVYLSNILLHSPEPDPAKASHRGRKVTLWAGSSFACLIAAALFLLLFLFCRAYWPKLH